MDDLKQEVIEKAWNQYAEAQQIHTGRHLSIHEIYELFTDALRIGWSLSEEKKNE